MRHDPDQRRWSSLGRLPAILEHDVPFFVQESDFEQSRRISDSPSRLGRVLLPEDDLFLGPVQRPSGADEPLQGMPNAVVDLGMTPVYLVENCDRPQARVLRSKGTRSLSHTAASRSRRRRSRGTFLSDEAGGLARCDRR